MPLTDADNKNPEAILRKLDTPWVLDALRNSGYEFAGATEDEVTFLAREGCIIPPGWMNPMHHPVAFVLLLTAGLLVSFIIFITSSGLFGLYVAETVRRIQRLRRRKRRS